MPLNGCELAKHFVTVARDGEAVGEHGVPSCQRCFKELFTMVAEWEDECGRTYRIICGLHDPQAPSISFQMAYIRNPKLMRHSFVNTNIVDKDVYHTVIDISALISSCV